MYESKGPYLVISHADTTSYPPATPTDVALIQT